MVTGVEGITLSSPSAKKLATFYTEKLGLKKSFEAVMGENLDLFVFEMKGCNLYIVDDPEVTGKSKDPNRIIFNLEVDDIESEVKRLEGQKVKQITELRHIEDWGYVSAFEDTDGNYIQLVQTKAK